MAEEPIRKEDIIDIPGIVNGVDDIEKAFIKLLATMMKFQKEGASSLSQILNTANPSSKEGIEVIKNTAEQTEILNTVNKELLKIENGIYRSMYEHHIGLSE